jgi:hypothetical protein
MREVRVKSRSDIVKPLITGSRWQKKTLDAVKSGVKPTFGIVDETLFQNDSCDERHSRMLFIISLAISGARGEVERDPIEGFGKILHFRKINKGFR